MLQDFKGGRPSKVKLIKMYIWHFWLFLLLGSCAELINKYETDADVQDHQYCIYVPYWVCEEDFSGVVQGERNGEKNIIQGIKGIDIRINSESLNIHPEDNATTNAAVGVEVCCPVECGKRIMIPKGVMVNRILEEPFGFRILGNTDTEFAEFPWMLGILEGITYRCGASLIHPQVALTAAHCLTGNGPFTIRAGEWNWKSKQEILPHQDRKAEKILIHPNFHPASLRNDIALIILDAPYQLIQNVGLICLPRQGAVFDHAICIVAGWGKNSHKKGTYQPILQKVNLPIVPRDKCLKSLRDTILGPHFTLHRSFICAGGEGGKDACKGDGGSPLMCLIEGTSDKYQQVGIVSWGFTCGKSNSAGVYVNLALFRNWIDFTLSAHGFNGAADRYGKRSFDISLNRTINGSSV